MIEKITIEEEKFARHDDVVVVVVDADRLARVPDVLGVRQSPAPHRAEVPPIRLTYLMHCLK